MSTERRLYCTPGAEECYFDPATSYECQIEPWHEPEDRERREIEEWSVRDSIEHVPSIDVLLDWLIEWTAENGELDEAGFEAFEKAAKHTDVCQAAASADRRVRLDVRPEHDRSLVTHRMLQSSSIP